MKLSPLLIFFITTISLAQSNCGDLHKKKINSFTGLSNFLDGVAKNEIINKDFSLYRKGLINNGHFSYAYHWSIPNTFVGYDIDKNRSSGVYIPKNKTAILLYSNESEKWNSFKDRYPEFEIYVKLDDTYRINDILSALKKKMPNLFNKQHKLWSFMDDSMDTIVFKQKYFFDYRGHVMSINNQFKVYGTFEQKYNKPTNEENLQDLALRLDSSIFQFSVEDVTSKVKDSIKCNKQYLAEEDKIRKAREKAKKKGKNITF